LRDNSVYIVDDFYVDPKLPSSNPFLIASTLARDLHLKPELVNSIAISILEQMHGLQVDKSIQGLPKVQLYHTTTTGQQPQVALLEVTEEMTAAWMIRIKEENVSRDVIV